MTAQIPEEAYALIDGVNFADVATLMPDGDPQVTPVWIDREDGVVRFNSAYGRVKVRNLQRDPRIALSVFDRENPYRYLQIRGRAELVDEGADAHIDALAKKYLGKDTYPFRQPGEQRVTIRVVPQAVFYNAP